MLICLYAYMLSMLCSSRTHCNNTATLQPKHLPHKLTIFFQL